MGWTINVAALFDNWKGILGSAAAGLVVILQIGQLLLSTTIEHTLDKKIELLRAKTDALSTLINANGDISKGNRILLEDNRKRAEEALAHIVAVEKELHERELQQKKEQ